MFLFQKQTFEGNITRPCSHSHARRTVGRRGRREHHTTSVQFIGTEYTSGDY